MAASRRWWWPWGAAAGLRDGLEHFSWHGGNGTSYSAELRACSAPFFFLPFLYIFLFIKEYFCWARQKQPLQPLQTPIIGTPLTSCPLISTVRACSQEVPDTLRVGSPYWRPTAEALRRDKQSKRLPYQFLQDQERSEPRPTFSLPPGPHTAVTSQEGESTLTRSAKGTSVPRAALRERLPRRRCLREIAALLPAASEAAANARKAAELSFPA